MNKTLDDITWAISWESRRLLAATSVIDRDAVKLQVIKIKRLLDDLEHSLSEAAAKQPEKIKVLKFVTRQAEDNPLRRDR